MSCYYLAQETHTDYLSANSTCQTLGGHIATISNVKETSWIQTKLNADLLMWQPAWAHYDDRLTERYKNLSVVKPNGHSNDEDCTEIYPTGSLNNVNCSNIALPICEKDVQNTCPQEYLCRNSSVCLPYLEGDYDFCYNKCPAGCTCKDFGVVCNAIEWNQTIIIKHSVAYLKLVNIRVPESSQRISEDGLKVLHIKMDFPLLLTAKFSNNEIQDILPGTFLNQTLMKELDLSSNAITHLNQGTLNGLTSLRSL
ncbi:uncharacterized protein LOC117118782 [Anneissia japonica]|uniref:uncharacterized protein LOC117118782 n=1 Tax=Anneissia japonica TaxID=1529436 RepID=UPI00142554BE|nr:uncharacterized protein LOC117118782 [Anneissia japonica]